jgi:branched-chain amino acid transport system ATP-binding protein
VADRAYVMERGTLVASGPAKLLARSTVVREAYLGAASATTTTAAQQARNAARSRPETTTTAAQGTPAATH